MIVNIYKANIDEQAKAFFSFLSSRPIIKTILLILNISCYTMLILFFLKFYAGIAERKDSAYVIITTFFLFFNKKLNLYCIKTNFKNLLNTEQEQKYAIYDKYILWNKNNKLYFKDLKLIYKNKDGYIIPFHGAKNAGKFIWLPLRGFNNNEKYFLDIINKFKIKIKQTKNI